MNIDSVIKEMMQGFFVEKKKPNNNRPTDSATRLSNARESGWETLRVDLIEPGYIVGTNPKQNSYVVRYTCSNVSEFFPYASSQSFDVIITQKEIDEYIVENRENKLNEIGI